MISATKAATPALVSSATSDAATAQQEIKNRLSMMLEIQGLPDRIAYKCLILHLIFHALYICGQKKLCVLVHIVIL